MKRRYRDQTIMFNGSATVLSYSGVVMSDSPVAYWRLGEAVGPSAFATVGGFTGTYTGGVTLGQAGAIVGDPNTAVLLNGTTGYVAVPHNAGYNVGDVFTLELWMKRTAATPGVNEKWLVKGCDGYFIGINDQRVEIAHQCDTIIGVTDQILTDTDWHHIVWTKNGATSHVYVDGVEEALIGFTNSTIQNTTDPLHIGAYQAPVTDFFNGTIDEVAIYPTALSAARVAAHFAASGH